MRILRIASAALLAGCAQGGGCTPIGDNWFPGSVLVLLGLSVVISAGIFFNLRNYMAEWRRTNRQDRRDERRDDRPWNEGGTSTTGTTPPPKPS